jgi:hypothetical protein
MTVKRPTIKQILHINADEIDVLRYLPHDVRLLYMLCLRLYVDASGICGINRRISYQMIRETLEVHHDRGSHNCAVVSYTNRKIRSLIDVLCRKKLIERRGVMVFFLPFSVIEKSIRPDEERHMSVTRTSHEKTSQPCLSEADRKNAKHGEIEGGASHLTNHHIKYINIFNDRSGKKFTNDDMTLAKFIFKRIQDFNAKEKIPDFEKWANTIRLMRERDERTHKEIQDVFVWANTNPFWQPNIRSPDKLRKQFTRLEDIIKQERNNGSHQQNNKPSKIQELEAANRYNIAYINRIESGGRFCEVMDSADEPLPAPGVCAKDGIG